MQTPILTKKLEIELKARQWQTVVVIVVSLLASIEIEANVMNEM